MSFRAQMSFRAKRGILVVPTEGPGTHNRGSNSMTQKPQKTPRRDVRRHPAL